MAKNVHIPPSLAGKVPASPALPGQQAVVGVPASMGRLRGILRTKYWGHYKPLILRRLGPQKRKSPPAYSLR